MENLLETYYRAVKHWYIPLIIGILFVVFGFYIFTVPLETYITLSIIFSISFIISGLLEIIFSIQNKDYIQGWGWYFVGGLLSLIMGIYLIIYPGISIAILPFVVGVTLLFRSFQMLGIAFDLKDKKISSWGNIAFASVLGILISLLLLAHPLFTGLSLVTLTALSFIFSGISAILFSLNLKKLKGVAEK